MKRWLFDPRIRLNSYLLPVLVVLLFGLQLITPYRGWRVLIIGLGGLWLVSYLWARSLARGVKLLRERRFGWAQVGDRMIERFTLENNGWAPALWAEVVDHSSLPHYNIGRGTGVSGQSAIRWHTEAICSRRGLFTLGPTALLTGDPFGVFLVRIDYPATTPLLVLPPIVPLPWIDIAPGGRAGEGRPRANAPERTVSAATVREYVLGDSIRWIHWPTSARRDELFVRIFDGTPAGDWWIILDLNKKVQLGEGIDSTEEYGIVLAASLADRGLRSSHAVGLVTHGESLVWMEPENGDGHRWEILRTLALVNPGARPLGDLLAGTGAAIGKQASLIIITPTVDSTWVETLWPLIRRGMTPTVLLLDPASFGGAGNLAGMRHLLEQWGITYYVIGRELLDRPELHPEREDGMWKVLGTGKAVMTHPVQNTEWRALR